MADFNVAVSITLTHEGGLADLPSDPGGLTNFGISIKAHPELSPDDVRSLTRDQAAAIYRKSYWNDLYDQITDQRIANSLFDFGVTSGIHIAVQTIQGIVFGRGNTALDGIFGPATIKALAADDQTAILKEYTTERLLYYANLPQTQFRHSWFARALDSVL
jgi:lysozyme family protein